MISTGVEFLLSVDSWTIPYFPVQDDVSTVTWADALQNFLLPEAFPAGPEGAPIIAGRWLMTEDFSGENCNWNHWPGVTLGVGTIVLSQDGGTV